MGSDIKLYACASAGAVAVGSSARVRGGGATGIGVSVANAVGVALGVAVTTPVGVIVGEGGFNKFGAIYKNAPKAIKLAKIHKIVVRLGKRVASLSNEFLEIKRYCVWVRGRRRMR